MPRFRQGLKKSTSNVNLSNAQYASGGRKASAARVYLVKGGSGKFTVNGKELADYFGRADHAQFARKPLGVVGLSESYDVFAIVKGGGGTGQAGAISNGVAKALALISQTYKAELRQCGLMTRDSRVVQSKKAGFRKARRRRQFSKR